MGEEKGGLRTFLPALPKIATRGGVKNTILFRICFRNHNLASVTASCNILHCAAEDMNLKTTICMTV